MSSEEMIKRNSQTHSSHLCPTVEEDCQLQEITFRRSQSYSQPDRRNEKESNAGWRRLSTREDI
jgi:hypothetical protein